jgi:hypothetical protein
MIPIKIYRPSRFRNLEGLIKKQHPGDSLAGEREAKVRGCLN